jgi:hypothetical protein
MMTGRRAVADAVATGAALERLLRAAGGTYHRDPRVQHPEAHREYNCQMCLALSGMAEAVRDDIRDHVRMSASAADALAALEDAREWLASRAEAPEVQRRIEAAQARLRSIQ